MTDLRSIYEEAVLPKEGILPSDRPIETARETLRHAIHYHRRNGRETFHTLSLRHWVRRKLAHLYPNADELVRSLLDEANAYNVMNAGELLEIGKGLLIPAPNRLVELDTGQAAVFSWMPTKELEILGVPIQHRGGSRFVDSLQCPALAALPRQPVADHLGFDVGDLNAEQYLAQRVKSGRRGAPGEGAEFYAGHQVAASLQWSPARTQRSFQGCRIALVRTPQGQFQLEIENGTAKAYSEVAARDMRRAQLAMDSLSQRPGTFAVHSVDGISRLALGFQPPNQLMRLIRLHGAIYDATTREHILPNAAAQEAARLCIEMGAHQEKNRT